MSPSLPSRAAVCGFVALAFALPGSALGQPQPAPPAAKAPPAAPAPPALPPTIAAFDIVFDVWAAKWKPATAILVVRRGGKTIFQKGHNADPAKPTFIASLTKAITAGCVATLIRDGRLSFTTPMKEAIPKLLAQTGGHADRRFADVTVEQLLAHRSGLLGNPDGDPIHAYIRKAAESGNGHIGDVRLILTDHFKNRLARDPGGNYAYSNTGYTVLTAIIEERTGRSYDDYCGEAVFGKLGLARAKLHPDWRVLSGGGGMFIPAPDYLALYDIFDPKSPFLGDTVKTWIDQAQTKGAPDNKGGWYSLGVETNSGRGRWNVSHGGLLNSRGKDARGRPTAALVVSYAARGADGAGIFIAVGYSQTANEALGELRREVARANQAVKLP